MAEGLTKKIWEELYGVKLTEADVIEIKGNLMKYYEFMLQKLEAKNEQQYKR